LNPDSLGASPETTELFSAPNGEIALLVGAALLTLLVVAFVVGLIVHIVREERAAGRTPDDPKGSDGARPDPRDASEARK
jgi:hypothetical protein